MTLTHMETEVREGCEDYSSTISKEDDFFRIYKDKMPRKVITMIVS